MPAASPARTPVAPAARAAVAPLLGLLLLIAACGQTGPLYLPGDAAANRDSVGADTSELGDVGPGEAATSAPDDSPAAPPQGDDRRGADDSRQPVTTGASPPEDGGRSGAAGEGEDDGQPERRPR